MVNIEAPVNLITSGSSGRSSKLSMVSSDSEIDDSEDEMTVYAWKENYMKQYGMDVNENDSRFKVCLRWSSGYILDF